MEELLNKLIEKGWKPFGSEQWKWIAYTWKALEGNKKSQYTFLREITAKESWLWQFVCENGMVKHEIYKDIQSWEHTTAEHSDFWYTSWDNYEYRLIQSALTDEDKLEDFILSNIKLD